MTTELSYLGLIGKMAAPKCRHANTVPERLDKLRHGASNIEECLDCGATRCTVEPVGPWRARTPTEREACEFELFRLQLRSGTP